MAAAPSGPPVSLGPSSQAPPVEPQEPGAEEGPATRAASRAAGRGAGAVAATAEEMARYRGAVAALEGESYTLWGALEDWLEALQDAATAASVAGQPDPGVGAELARLLREAAVAADAEP
jgi:hypothetical protein